MTHLTHARRRSRSSWLLTGLLALVSAGCAQEGLLRPGEGQDEDLTVTNDQATLAQRVQTLTPDTVSVVAEFVVSADRPHGTTARDRLRLVREIAVAPPSINGRPLQASHIMVDGRRAYVAYNTQGPEYRGGADIFSWEDGRARLRSQALWDGTDVSALREVEGRLYLAAARNDPALSSPAILAEITLADGLFSRQLRLLDLPSFVATSVAAAGGHLYVTTGSSTDGGLFVVQPGDLSFAAMDEHLDARAVDANHDLVATWSGTPGVMRLYQTPTGNRVGQYAVGGANIAESKSTIEMAHGHAFIAAGDEGLKIVRLRDGAVVATIPVSDMAPTVDANTVTNGVSVNDDLVFVANGGGGLFVLHIELDGSGDVDMARVGRIAFPESFSVNHVASRGDRVLAATGHGGLQVVRISER